MVQKAEAGAGGGWRSSLQYNPDATLDPSQIEIRPPGTFQPDTTDGRVVGLMADGGGNWFQDIAGSLTGMVPPTGSLSSASGDASDVPPYIQEQFDQAFQQMAAGGSTTTDREPPTLQQIVHQAAAETGGRFAYSSNLPGWMPQVFKQAQKGRLAPDDFLVYFGDAPETKAPATQEPLPGMFQDDRLLTDGGGDKILTLTQAQNLPVMWTEERVKKVMDRMREAGLDVKSFQDLENVWNELVTHAARAYTLSGGDKQLTPWDVLDLYKSTGSDAAIGGVGGIPFTGTKTQTYRSVNELTEGQVWSVMRSTVQQLLGHDPSDQDLRSFTYKANQLAARNPSVTKTASHYEDGELVSQTSHTSGGFTQDDAMQAAYNRAQNDPDYGEFQAATTYFDAALQGIGAIGSP